MIEEKTGLQVNIVTIATPAYNDGSSEDPQYNASIKRHIHIYSSADGVDAIAGGDEEYDKTSHTTNLSIPSNYIKDEGTIDTHSNMGDKNKNAGIGNFLRNLLNLKKK